MPVTLVCKTFELKLGGTPGLFSSPYHAPIVSYPQTANHCNIHAPPSDGTGSIYCPQTVTQHINIHTPPSDGIHCPQTVKYLQLSTLYPLYCPQMVYRYFPSFRTDRHVQTVQTQIRLSCEEQSDQGPHCLQFPLHRLDALLLRKSHLFQLLG